MVGSRFVSAAMCVQIWVTLEPVLVGNDAPGALDSIEMILPKMANIATMAYLMTAILSFVVIGWLAWLPWVL